MCTELSQLCFLSLCLHSLGDFTPPPLPPFLPSPHNLNLPSGVCESFPLIILSDVWHLFFYLTLKKKKKLSFHCHKLIFSPLCVWKRRWCWVSIAKIFIASPGANIFKTIWPGTFTADYPCKCTHMRCGGRPGSGNPCRSSLAVMLTLLIRICSVWEDARVVIPVLFDRFGSSAHYWGNDKWDQAGPSGPSAFIFSARTQRSLMVTMDEISI